MKKKMHGYRDSSMGTMGVKKGQGEMSLKGEKLGLANGVPRELSAREHFLTFGSEKP